MNNLKDSSSNYFEIDNSCNSFFTDSQGNNCTAYADNGWCNLSPEFFLTRADSSGKAWETGLNCDECGCDGMPTSLYDIPIVSVVATNPNTHRFCEIIDGWTAECSSEQCYPYVHEDDYFYNYDNSEYYYEDFACEYTISSVCDSNFVDRYGDACGWYGDCEGITNREILNYGVLTAEGYKTALNCPSCGCGENGPINFHDRDVSRSLAGNDKKIKKKTNKN